MIAALAACTKAPLREEAPVSDGMFSVTATLPGADTKTSISYAEAASRHKIYWENGDKISAGSSNISAALSGVSATSTATFTFSKAVSNGDFVRCPGVEDPSVLTIPAEQTSVDGQYDSNANPLWGIVSTGGTSVPQASLILNNTMAMFKFSVKGTDASLSKATFEAVGGEAINGTFQISTSGVISGGTNTGCVNTINFSSALALSSAAVDIYIPILPGTYSDGYVLKLYDNAGRMAKYTINSDDVKTLTNANLAKFDITYAAGRVEVILPISVLNALDGKYSDDAPANSIKIGTYNLWSPGDRATKIQGGSTDSARSWANAKTHVAATIAAMDCDVICFNEIDDQTYSTSVSGSLENAVRAFTTDYTFSIDWPNKVSSSWFGLVTTTDFSYANGFAYKSSLLTLNASGRFWLNDTFADDDDDNSYGHRTAVWAKFTQKSSNKIFYVVSTHLSIENQGSSDNGTPGLSNLMTAKNLVAGINKSRLSGWSSSSPILVCGDFNSSHTSNNKGFRYIVNVQEDEPNGTLVFTDSRDYLASNSMLASSEKGLPGTSNGEKNDTAERFSRELYRVDHIVYRNCSVSNYTTYRRIYTFENDFWYPSDHLPISVNVLLP